MAHEFKQEQLEKDLDDLEKLITSHRMSPRGALAMLSMQFIAGAYDVAPSERAFEQVLAPRFTRDEAIAIVRGSVDPDTVDPSKRAAFSAGVRHALEALAAAGVFVDEPCDALCNPRTCRNNMADKLDAAGIR